MTETTSIEYYAARAEKAINESKSAQIKADEYREKFLQTNDETWKTLWESAAQRAKSWKETAEAYRYLVETL